MPQTSSSNSLSAERLYEINGELINACLDGNFQRTKELCKQYPACINIIGGSGYPPLHYALFTQNYDLTTYMVEHGGADPNVVNALGSHSLHAAATLGDQQLFSECMPKVQDLELRNRERESPQDILERAPSTADLQFPLIFQGWHSSFNQQDLIDKITNGRRICRKILIDEINRRARYDIHFIRHSLVADQEHQGKLRDYFHGSKNHAIRRFTSKSTLPAKSTSLEWNNEVRRLYESRPDLKREMMLRYNVIDLTERAIQTAARNVQQREMKIYRGDKILSESKYKYKSGGVEVGDFIGKTNVVKKLVPDSELYHNRSTKGEMIKRRPYFIDDKGLHFTDTDHYKYKVAP